MLLLPVCIEGSKGSGKTTTIQGLTTRLESKGIDVTTFAPFAVADDFARTKGFGGAVAMSDSSKDNNQRVVHFVMSAMTSAFENVHAQADQTNKPTVLIYDRGWMTLQAHLRRFAWFAADRDDPKEINRLTRLLLQTAPATVTLTASAEVTKRRRHATLTAAGIDADAWIARDLAFHQSLVKAFPEKISLGFDTGETPQDEVLSKLETFIDDKFTDMQRIQSLRPKKKHVALYAGSFNLATEGHRVIGTFVRDIVQPDEVWYLVSPQNPHKAAEGMAAFHHRVEMLKLNVAGVPRLVVSEVEKEISKQTHTTYSSETLSELIKRNPDTHFSLILGADTFAVLHTWHDYKYILSHASIIMIPRTDWTEKALNSPASQEARQLHDNEDLRTRTGWMFMENFPEGPGSATQGREKLSHGESIDPRLIRPEVQRYAIEHNVFDASPA